MQQLDVTPAEAMVLRNPTQRTAQEGIKASLMWLVAQGHLRIVNEGGRFWKRKVMAQDGPRPAPLLPADLQAVLTTVRATPSRKLAEISKAMQSRYGLSLNRFRTEVVIPRLVRRGLLVETQKSFLLLFKRQSFELTSRGRALAAEIEQRLEKAAAIPGLLTTDKAMAVALALSLGGLILIAPSLRDSLGDLAAEMKRLRAGSGDSGSSGGGAGGSSGGTPASEGERLPESVDLPEFDLGGLDSLDIPSFTQSFDAVDGGFDAAGGGGDGGSGGGGGD